ncbi:Acetyltransferase [Collimonas arenae]|uniref:Acetyltransferase n=1 Tax=Collimonas arenae TaxID=279058 RepID=A0A0A1FFG2_9BURK|nr:Acetyltransferase [Collimonas arenae]
MTAPVSLDACGVSLHACATSDIGFLRDLYHQLRSDELAQVPWPRAHKIAFLDSQFTLQHKHYLSHFKNADFLRIDANGQPIGRIYLSRQAPEFLIVDISLLPAWRGNGIGSALIRHIQILAEGVGSCVNLHVDERNAAARRLYERLGFVATAQEGPYTAMRWLAAAKGSSPS